MKRFFLLSAGLLCLSLTMLIGAQLVQRTAHAQAAAGIAAVAEFDVGSHGLAVADNGDLYLFRIAGDASGFAEGPSAVGNVFTGEEAEPDSWVYEQDLEQRMSRTKVELDILKKSNELLNRKLNVLDQRMDRLDGGD